MREKRILEELNKIFCEIFDNSKLRLEMKTSAEDIEDWDSFEQINLIIAIEDFYNIKLTIKEVNELKNVGEMVSYISERIKSEENN